MPKDQRTDDAIAGSYKRLTSRFFQLQMGHCLSDNTPNGRRPSTSLRAGEVGTGCKYGIASLRNARSGRSSSRYWKHR